MSQKAKEAAEVEASEPAKIPSTELPPINVLEDEVEEESEDSAALKI